MADSLGSAVLTLSVDDGQFRAGLGRAQQLLQQTGRSLENAFSGSAGQSLNGLNIKLRSLQQEFQNVAIGTKRFQELKREIKDTQKELDRLTGVGKGGVLGNIATALTGIGAGAALAGFFKGAIEKAVELETITKKLSNTLGNGGAAKALSFTKELADRLGLSYKTLANSFGSFTAAATSAGVPLDQQRKLFAAVATSAQRLGLSNDELKGSLLALQQVASKGTVQMEELRGQLGERLPVAFGATAKGLGITQQQLIKLVETGRLASGEFFAGLTKGLNDLNSASTGAPTAAQNFQILANSWDELQTSFGNDLLPAVIDRIKELNAVVQGLGIKKIADQLGFNTGAIGSLGFLSDEAIDAAVAYKRLRDEQNLTDKQATSLFFDARKNLGFGPGQLLNNDQTSRLISEAEKLASEWRKRFPIADPIIDQPAVDESLNTIQKIQDQIKKLQQEQISVDFDSSRFAEAGIEIDRLQRKLKELTQSNATAGSLERFNQALQAANEQLSKLRVNADSINFRSAVADVASLEVGLRAVQGATAGVKADILSAGIAAGDFANSFENVNSVLQNLEQFRGTLDIDSSAFVNATADILQTQDQLRQLDGQKATIEAELIVKGLENGSLVNSIGLQQQLSQAFRAAAESAPLFSEQFYSAVQNYQDANKGLEIAAGIMSGAFKNGQDAINQAAQKVESVLIGNFDLLTKSNQRQLIDNALANIDFNVFSSRKIGRDPRKILQAYQGTQQLNAAQQDLGSTVNAVANLNKTSNQLANVMTNLIRKDWTVNVSVNAATGASGVQLG